MTQSRNEQCENRTGAEDKELNGSTSETNEQLRKKTSEIPSPTSTAALEICGRSGGPLAANETLSTIKLPTGTPSAPKKMCIWDVLGAAMMDVPFPVPRTDTEVAQGGYCRLGALSKGGT